jgi:hypothetical protein
MRDGWPIKDCTSGKGKKQRTIKQREPNAVRNIVASKNRPQKIRCLVVTGSNGLVPRISAGHPCPRPSARIALQARLALRSDVGRKTPDLPSFLCAYPRGPRNVFHFFPLVMPPRHIEGEGRRRFANSLRGSNFLSYFCCFESLFSSEGMVRARFLRSLLVWRVNGG